MPAIAPEYMVQIEQSRSDDEVDPRDLPSKFVCPDSCVHVPLLRGFLFLEIRLPSSQAMFADMMDKTVSL
jgi:hypothetical protein